MAGKFIVLVASLTVARAAIIASPSASAVAVAHPTGTLVRTDAFDADPQYSYSYSVADGLTGDNKAQQESRNGDVVQGSYSLVEPDGSRRTVSYASDPINGFNAVVQKDPNYNLHARVVSPVLRVQPLHVVSRRPVLESHRSDTVVASADANVVRQSTVVSASSHPYANGVVGLRSDGAYGIRTVQDNYGYGSARVVRVD